MNYGRFFRGLRVLVTGATGFIGSHLAERLVALGAHVRCLVRPTSRTGLLPAGVELAVGDLGKGEGVRDAVRGVPVVFHLAGVTKALSSRQYHSGNALATRHLVEALDDSCRRLVHVSSLAVVGPSRDGSPLSEDAVPSPVSCYGRSKLEAERAVRGWALAERAVILRPPVVFGPRDTDVLEIFRMVARGWMLVVGDPNARFSVVYVEDLVEGLLAAAACERAGGRTYFVAHPAPVSWAGFAGLAGGVLGVKPRLVRAPWPLAWMAAFGWEAAARVRRKPAIISRDKIAEARAGEWICDVRRARAELDYEARTPLAEAVARTIAWYRQAGLL